MMGLCPQLQISYWIYAEQLTTTYSVGAIDKWLQECYCGSLLPDADILLQQYIEFYCSNFCYKFLKVCTT